MFRLKSNLVYLANNLKEVVGRPVTVGANESFYGQRVVAHVKVVIYVDKVIRAKFNVRWGKRKNRGSVTNDIF
jgi:hypothetical protein